VTIERRADLVAVVLYGLGIAAGVVSIFYRPFVFAPAGVLLILVAVVMSANNRRLATASLAFVALGWMIGASIAIWDSNPLY
jgi:hypothetical protein